MSNKTGSTQFGEDGRPVKMAEAKQSSMAQVLCNPSKLLVGKMFPCYYRTNVNALDGNDEVATKALERWTWCHEHPPILLHGD